MTNPLKKERKHPSVVLSRKPCLPHQENPDFAKGEIHITICPIAMYFRLKALSIQSGPFASIMLEVPLGKGPAANEESQEFTESRLRFGRGKEQSTIPV